MPEAPLSLEAVLRELQIDETELDELIAAGDLHPRGDGADRRFDPDEVWEVRQRKEGYPTIPLFDLKQILPRKKEEGEGS